MLAMAVTLAAAKSRFAHATSPAHFSLIALVNNAAETIGRKSPLAAKFGAFDYLSYDEKDVDVSVAAWPSTFWRDTRNYTVF